MTAPTRRDAAGTISTGYAERALARWRAAEPIRREWLDHGLDTAPADRPTTEDIVARLYARHRRQRPRFRWVDSPHEALPLVAGLPTHDMLHRWVTGRPPAEAFAAGVPLRVVLRQGIWAALRVSLADGFFLPVRAALAASGRPVPSAWYGQQDAYWVAYYDVLRRLGLAHYRRADEAQLDEWATLARCAGWWWPGERICVLVDRPAVLRTERVPGGWHDERRLARDGAAPIGYRDGWSLSLRAVSG